MPENTHVYLPHHGTLRTIEPINVNLDTSFIVVQETTDDVPKPAVNIIRTIPKAQIAPTASNLSIVDSEIPALIAALSAHHVAAEKMRGRTITDQAWRSAAAAELRQLANDFESGDITHDDLTESYPAGTTKWSEQAVIDAHESAGPIIDMILHRADALEAGR